MFAISSKSIAIAEYSSSSAWYDINEGPLRIFIAEDASAVLVFSPQLERRLSFSCSYWKSKVRPSLCLPNELIVLLLIEMGDLFDSSATMVED